MGQHIWLVFSAFFFGLLPPLKMVELPPKVILYSTFDLSGELLLKQSTYFHITTYLNFDRSSKIFELLPQLKDGKWLNCFPG